MPYVIGQICGILATAASIIMPLYKKKWMMLVNTALINVLMGLNLVLIGEVGSAAALCAVATVQCIVSLVHTLRERSPAKWETALFFLLYLAFGFWGFFRAPGFAWELSGRNALELLPILGSLCSMTFVFIRSEQKARWVLLLTCTVWSVYTGLVGATTFFAQLFSLLTTVTALIKYRRRP